MSPRAWACFAATSVIWGSSFLFIKVAVEDGVSPATLVLVRTALGALVLAPLALRRDALRGLRPRTGALLALAVIDVALPFGLVAWGERSISSSLAGILVATDPLFVALLAIAFDRSERVRGWRLAGLFVGFAGVVVLLGVDLAGSTDELLAAEAVLAASLAFAASALLYKRRFADAEPPGVVTATLAVGALLAAPAVLLSPPDDLPSAGAVGSLAVLGVLNTGVGFWLFYALIALAGAGRASAITYVNPAVAVVLGALLLHEPVTPTTIAGFAIILLGSWFAAGR
jgi:drug/metabolite transporter (DMT)-like permease